MKDEGIGLTRCEKDHCVYVRWKDGFLLIVVVYVDDLTIACDDLGQMDEFKNKIKGRFAVRDLGEINYILKMEISRDRKNRLLSISQRSYIEDLVDRFGVGDKPGVTTPQDAKLKLDPVKLDDGQDQCKLPYRSLVGALIHVAKGTRPDIVNAVRHLSRYLSCFAEEHFNAGLRVLCYLKHTSDYGILYDGKLDTKAFSLHFEESGDASFGALLDDRRSVIAFVSMACGECVSWKSFLNSSICLSSTQAEIIAMSEAGRDVEWIRILLGELNYLDDEPTKLWCDNQSTIEIVKKPVNYKGTKHIALRHLYARQLQEKKVIDIKYCPTGEQIADLLTKPLPVKVFEYLRSLIGVTIVLNSKRYVPS